MVEKINLDDVDEADLLALRERLDREVDLIQKQISYIKMIAVAKGARKSGNIALAQKYEREADAYYNQMPEEIKW